MKNKQEGFIHTWPLILLLLIIGVIVFTGLNVRNKDKEPTAKSNSQHVQRTTDKPTFNVPKDYITYSDKINKFSVSYPSNWGEMTIPTDPEKSFYATASTNELDLKFGQSHLTSQLGVLINKKPGFTFVADKYGATISPAETNGNIVWKVISVNPADSIDKVGDIYKPVALKTQSGLAAYVFNQTYEDVMQTRWVIVTSDAYTILSMPTMSGYNFGTIPRDDLTSYNVTASNILKSFRAD